MSEENCTEGSKSGWHNKPPPLTPPSKQCKHGEVAAHGAVFVGEKIERLDIYPPQHRAEQFPNDLYVSDELLFCKEADLRNHN